MIGIYVITNKINGKQYVGQSQNILARWEQYEQAHRLNLCDYAIYKAFNKYGFENFEFSILEQCDLSELNDREKYWISKLHTYLKDPECNGYNMTLGGEGNQLVNIQQIYELWDMGLSVKQIATKTNHDRGTIRKHLLQYKNYSKDLSNERGDKIQAQSRFVPVEQYSLQGEYIDTYYNMHEAERQTGVSSKNIWCVVHEQSLTAGGYQWKFTTDNKEIKPLDKVRKYKQTVKQYSLDGTLLNTYESASEASKKTNISDTQIRKVCQGKGRTAGGYIWKYEGSDL